MKIYYLAGIACLFLVQACAPPAVTKKSFSRTQANLPTDIEVIQLETFDSVLGQNVFQPNTEKVANLKVIKSEKPDFFFQNEVSVLSFEPNAVIALQPALQSFEATHDVSSITEAAIFSHFSKRSTYVLLSANQTQQGVVYSDSQTAVLKAKVYYFEESFEEYELVPYSLLLFNESSPVANSDSENESIGKVVTDLIIKKTTNFVLEESFRYAAQGATADSPIKGVYLQDTPYIEKIAGLRVEIEMVRKSNQESLFKLDITEFINAKWGGRANSSHVPINWRAEVPLNFFVTSTSEAATSLEIKNKLADQAAQKLMAQFFLFDAEVDFEIADGNETGQTYLKAGAYLYAINYLNSIDREPADDYNLALAHQALGENSLAVNYYINAIDREPKDLYKNSLRQLLNWLKSSTSEGANHPLVRQGQKALK